MKVLGAVIFWLVLLGGSAAAFAPQEQEYLLEQSLEILARELGGSYDRELRQLSLPAGDAAELVVDFGERGFGETAAASVDDDDPGRQHPLGSTLYTELTSLSAEDLQQFLEAEKGKAPGGNVSARFLAHHWRALHLAQAAGQGAGQGVGQDAGQDAGQDEGQRASATRELLLRKALLEEALALSHLMDAFSSGHFFYPGRDLFDWLHRTNNSERHRRLRFLGAYVMDSRGSAWQTFGDGLLRWHPKTQEMVGSAVLTALREFFLVYFGEAPPSGLARWRDEHSPLDDARAWVASWLEPRDGTVYYEEFRIPSLMRVPMEIRASWSERDGSRIEHGIASRHHWPQLQDSGGHDPGFFEEFVRELPREDEQPDWLRFPRLSNATPEALVLEDAEVASVRFDQQRRLPPTFKGGLLIVGGGRNLDGEDSTWLLTGGLGWGIADRLLPLRRLPVLQRMSVEMRGHWNPEASDAYGVFALATQLNTGRWPGALHLELGLADGWQGRYTSWGLHLGIGLASSSVKLPGIYAGGMVRLRYSVAYMGEAMHSVLLDFLVH